MSGAEIALDGNFEELERLFEEVSRFCRENGLGSEVEFDLNLALDELFANAVRHGGCAGMKRAAQVRLERLEDCVRVEYSDRGRLFDPTAAPRPNLAAPLAERPSGGLGLHLVRQTMRDLKYWSSDGWNHLAMRRPI